jgi:Right handed beta helix region
MRILSLVFATILSVVLSAVSAQAQATRTWVSGVGDDANPCSRTAPCKTFAGAISKTAPNGEINVLDPGGFGGVTITKSITISSEGFEAGVLVSGTNGIIVNAAATDEITLKGLDIEGLGSGLNGVNILSASKVHIIKCSIHNFTQSGVNLAGPTGARVVVQNSIITSNLIGVTIAGASGAANTGLVLNTTIDNNTGSSIQVGAGSTLILGGSRLIGSATSVSSAGTFTSFGDNAIQGTGNPNNTIQLR